jgi:hypothetical protein
MAESSKLILDHLQAIRGSKIAIATFGDFALDTENPKPA